MQRDRFNSHYSDLKKALMHSITLHERLRDILKEESGLIMDYSPDELRGANAEKRTIENEIEKTNRTLSELFDSFHGDPLNLDAVSRCEIGSLMDRLRETIRDTLGAIGETLDSVRKARSNVIGNIREMNSRKAAVSTYMKVKYM